MSNPNKPSADPYAAPAEVDEQSGMSAGEFVGAGVIASGVGLLTFALACFGFWILSASTPNGFPGWRANLGLSAVVAMTLGLLAGRRTMKSRRRLQQRIAEIEHEAQVELSRLKHEVAQRERGDSSSDQAS